MRDHDEGCPPRIKLLTQVVAGEYVPHLETCEECAEFVAAAKAAVSAFNEPDELEHAVAELITAVLADVPSGEWRSVLLATRELHRSVIVRDLLRRSDEWYGRDPRTALEFSTAAVEICDAMAARGDAPKAELIFEALKEHSTLLRQMQRLDEAQEFLSRAWAVASDTAQPELHSAIISLCVAITYAEPDLARFDEAIGLAETAATVLDVYGDQRRVVIAWHTKAYVLTTMGRYAAAEPLLRKVIGGIMDAGGSPRDCASAHGLLALILVHLGSFHEAAEHAIFAENIHASCGDDVDAARAAHVAARALAEMGRFAEVRREFARTAEIVFAAGMFDVWCLMRLDYIALALADDPGADVRGDVEAVARVCMTVAAKDSTTRQQYAAEAMDYLRRLALRDAVTSDVVNHVRAFMQRNASHRPARFAPLPGTAFLM